MWIKEKFLNMTIRAKLVWIFVLIMGIVVFVNLYMFISVNRMIRQMDEVYISNSDLNELLECLDGVQESMTGYLNTKATESIQEFYQYEQKYEEKLENFNLQISNNSIKLKEKNIRKMSENYLAMTEKTIEAKRGRNVERYSKEYEESKKIYEYIAAYIYSLNNEQFKNNSNSYQVLSMSLHYVEMVSVFVMAAIALSNILLIILVTRHITKPLTELVEIANQVGKGNFNVQLLEVRSRDEVGVVSMAFNKMVASISLYIEKIKENMKNERMHKEKELLMESHLKDAKLKYLQAQINPHFLFNTLNAGAQLAMMEEADRTYEYVQRVAELFRYNMKNNEIVTLREEVELIDIYIYILNVRFSGEIHFKKEIEEEVLETKIPSMILQPIIENSINYGIRNISWEGLITLSAYGSGNKVYISIKDNGIGISQDKIEKILAGTMKEEDLGGDSNGIGLDNVISRMRLFCGEKDVVEIWSEGKNKGTETILYLPETEKDYV